MTEHFTKNTVSAAFPCPKCKTTTQHRIDGGRKGPCLVCIEKLEAAHQSPKLAPVKQEDLFR